MGKHVEVHGGGHEDGSLHAEVGGDEHVVGHAVCHLTDGGGCGRGYEHGIGPKTETDVAVPRAVALGEKVADDGLRRERTQGDGGDELLTGRGDDHLYLSSAPDEAADDETCLVGCNAARDAQNDFLTLEHISFVKPGTSVWCLA